MPNLFNKQFKLLRSAYNKSQLKYHNLTQIAFFGRSNVGKSSLINNLCQQKDLARTSKPPGRTSSINFFSNDNFLLVDLPGYGYAKTNRNGNQKWEELLLAYLNNNNHLFRAFSLIDSRRGIMESDHRIYNLFHQYNIPFQIILTKSDKISNKELETLIDEITLILEDNNLFFTPVIKTSSFKKIGIDTLRKNILKIINR